MGTGSYWVRLAGCAVGQGGVKMDGWCKGKMLGGEYEGRVIIFWVVWVCYFSCFVVRRVACFCFHCLGTRNGVLTHSSVR